MVSLYIVENANDKTVELFGNHFDSRYVWVGNVLLLDMTMNMENA